MIKDEWKDIKNYENIYKVNKNGKIINIKRNKIRKSRIDKYGYERIILNKNNKKQNLLVHRLVAEAFIPNPNNLPQINHKDENKQNNNVNNLEWCTQKYNCNYGTKNERAKLKISQANKGKHYSINTEFKKGNIAWNKNINTYYRAKKVKCVELNKIYNSIMDASRELNIKHQNIMRSCISNYKAGGYKFEYE